MPPPKLELSWDDYVKQNANFTKEFTLGIKKLKLDPKLQAQMLALAKQSENKVKAIGKKNAKNGVVNLKKADTAYKKEKEDITKKLNSMLESYNPPKPDPKQTPQKQKKDWGKIKLKHGPFNLEFKVDVKKNKIKLQTMGGLLFNF